MYEWRLDGEEINGHESESDNEDVDGLLKNNRQRVPTMDNNDDNNESTNSKHVDGDECKRMVDLALRKHHVDSDGDDSDDKGYDERHDNNVDDNKKILMVQK